MRVLITGATGFVGRNLLLRLLSNKKVEHIYVAVRNPQKLYAQLEEDNIPLPPHLEVIEASSPVWNIPPLHIDALVHCAGALFENTEEAYFKTNVEGTMNLLHRVPEEAKCIILSSQAAGGPCVGNAEVRGEEEEDAPLTWYGKSKKVMETQILEHCGERPVYIFRPPMILGARDTATLPLFKMAQKPIRFKVGMMSKWFSYVAVEDLVTLIEMALFCDNIQATKKPVFYVCHPEPITDKQLITQAGISLNKKGITFFIPHWKMRLAGLLVRFVPWLEEKIPSLGPDRIHDLFQKRWVNESLRATEVFGWKPQSSYQEALREASQWYQKKGLLTASGTRD